MKELTEEQLFIKEQIKILTENKRICNDNLKQLDETIKEIQNSCEHIFIGNVCSICDFKK